MSESAIRVALVYPELLGTYGDRGNAVILGRRLAWRGVAAELVEVRAGQPVPGDVDVFVLGGGEDDPQSLAADGLRASRAAIDHALAGGAAMLAVCAGFQLLGHSYEAADDEHVPGLALLDIVTVAGADRLVGECVVEPEPPLPLLTGFENHAGRTKLGDGVDPLGTVRSGHGNGDHPAVDGARAGRVVGTYLHGPVLARNPALADLLLGWVAGELPPIDDELALRLRAERLAAAGA